ncbi:MAG: DUF87 domain-containing protein [Campylobacter sp.]|nr:DUF87 domain-containing protein [Campylobacter sp.]
MTKTLQEDLKLFYLGLKEGEPYLYKSKDLTTHATIVGMTGSGKTGLGITLLEEAMIDGIPAFVIDPKGDMTNLALTFPELKDSDFLPYIDENDANSKGISKNELAQNEANTWQKGVESSFQSKERIELLKNSAEVRIYTPKSSDGLSVSLLKDFVAPKGLDGEDLNSYVEALSTSMLSLVGEESSNSALLFQNIFLHSFQNGKDLTIVDLIYAINTPPFDKVGVFDIETFYPSDKRMALSMKINNLFASPSFSQWCVGDSLDISSMLFNDNGKARCNIFTISHLSDSERMFFVTLLLNEIVRWMRTTSGTSSLRALVYMDEIFGFFPPNGNPPSKKPMLTLLKQARAHGIGVVLSMQNPVDLDYKGLSNMGTWFIGRLQTDQDKERIISGITGVSGSEYEKNELLKMISSLKKREFLVKNTNADGLDVISTRFALSYLKGPLNRDQISNLMRDKKSTQNTANPISEASSKPIISKDIDEVYSYGALQTLSPYLFGTAKVRYTNKDFDITQDISLCLAVEDADFINWDEASINPNISFGMQSDKDSKYANLPSFIASAKNLNEYKKTLKDYIYRNVKLELYSAFGMNSMPGEKKDDFVIRLHDKVNELLEIETEKFESKFNSEKAKLEDKIAKAQVRLEKEQSESKSKLIDAAISIGGSIFGAILGSKKLSQTTIAKAATGAKSAGRALNQRKDVELAKDSLDKLTLDMQNLLSEYDEKLKELKIKYNTSNLELKITEVAAKKSDIYDEKVVLLWKS